RDLEIEGALVTNSDGTAKGVSLSGDLRGSGTLDLRTDVARLVFAGAAPQSVLDAGDFRAGRLVIDNPTTVTLQSHVEALELELTQGHLAATTGSLALGTPTATAVVQVGTTGRTHAPGRLDVSWTLNAPDYEVRYAGGAGAETGRE